MKDDDDVYWIGAQWEWGHKALGEQPWSIGDLMTVIHEGQKITVRVTEITPDAIKGEVIRAYDR